ncbi:MAG: Ig-like domain-containing protein [Ignavibacteriales bacterium]|nr:Ig-like domain-containing protein [Ignavibacteriales bacterium]
MRTLICNVSRCIAATLLLSCAGQVPPGGGPEDFEPPEIVSVYPAPFTTSYDDTKIVLEFSEYVNRPSVNESIFISPAVGSLEFDWSGKEVEISFSQVLRKNTTYVVNVGTDVKDTRRGNRMAQAFALAFSTGDSIDRGAIEGMVYPSVAGKPVTGVMMFAYKLDGMDPDTLDPSTLQPDYITQTGQDGRFFFRHVSIGPYRVFAVRDEYRDLLYDPETDEYAVLQNDVMLTETDTLAAGLVMRLARQDTTAPRLVEIRTVHQSLLTLGFSEGLDSACATNQAVQIVDTSDGSALGVRSLVFKLPQRKELFVLTDRQEGGKGYRTIVSGLRDSVGLPISPIADRLTFEGSGIADTVRPALSGLTFADSTKNMEIDPVLFVYFSEPVTEVGWELLVQFRDTVGPVSFKARWLGHALELRPRNLLTGNMWYTVSVNTGILLDFAGNKGKDTVLSYRFQTIDTERLSGIEGIVVDRAESDTSGLIVLTARDADRKSAIPRQVSVARSGPFVFDRLLEGRYVLEAFRDRNNNGMYDAGSARPFSVSERFTVHADTLRLRARWPIEGVVLQLR